MRQILIPLITLLLVSTSCLAADIPPPNLEVNAYLLRDFNSGANIVAHNHEAKLKPASLTKIMTAYIVFDALKEGHLTLGTVVPVSTKAWQAEGSRMFIEPQKSVTVDELLHGLIIQSGNDAAIALAEAVAGSETQFAIMMNQQAKRIGMRHTHFMNATGLPADNHYTTAHDLALMAEALIRDFPKEYGRLYPVKEYTYNKITQLNRNRLLWLDANVDGMKTGHTAAAGYCLVSSAKRDKTRLIAVVLGAKSESMRASESQRLLNYGFQFYESTLVYRQSQAITKIKVYKGAQKTVSATVAKHLYLSLPKGDYARVKATMTTKQPLIAPIKAGQVIGKMAFLLDGKTIQEETLVAATDVSEAGFFGNIIDSIKLLIQ
jgi:serine-type D-Ala-D-Ala carboxypeptidase (penicillin-binding protein 5/6)